MENLAKMGDLQETEDLRKMEELWKMEVRWRMEHDGLVRDGDEAVHVEFQHPVFQAYVCRSHIYTSARETSEGNVKHKQNDVSIFAHYLGSRSQPTATSRVSKAHCGLFCMDIKYFSLSSNSVF